MKFNREIPIFGKEHCKLQASFLAVRNNMDVTMLQATESVEAGFGFMSVPSSDVKHWKEKDADRFEEQWNIVGTVTPLSGKVFLVELGLDIDEVLTAENILI